MDLDAVGLSLFANPEIQGGNVMRDDNAGVVGDNIRLVSDLCALVYDPERAGHKPHSGKDDSTAKYTCYDSKSSFHDSLQG